MYKTIEVQLSPQEAFDPSQFKEALSNKFNIGNDSHLIINPIRRSVDARGKNVSVKVLVELIPAGEVRSAITYKKNYTDVSKADPIIIVGSGPAGLFAAMFFFPPGSERNRMSPTGPRTAAERWETYAFL